MPVVTGFNPVSETPRVDLKVYFDLGVQLHLAGIDQ
jgi:hypothetical protein